MPTLVSRAMTEVMVQRHATGSNQQNITKSWPQLHTLCHIECKKIIPTIPSILCKITWPFITHVKRFIETKDNLQQT